MAYFPYVTPRGDITFPAFFIVVVFKLAANSRFVELNKKTKQVDTSKHFSLSYVVRGMLCFVPGFSVGRFGQKSVFQD